MIHLREHGAVGDGVADDTAAVRSAIATGEPLDWGGEGDVYRITDSLLVEPDAAVRWVSDGATIRCDAPEAVQYVTRIEANGHPVRIDGPLIIDAAQTAFSCLSVRNQGAAVPVTLTDVTAVNAYRSSTAYTGGDGIGVRGAFDPVTLTRPTVRNVGMAAEAAIPGSQGITGITVSAFDSARLPGTVSIDSPIIENILSDDTETHMDQDGIRVMTANHEAGVVAPYETQVRIVGGSIRNTGGRALKSQVPWCSIADVKVYRDVQRAPVFREIDFQKGGGHVSNVSVHYVNTASVSVVSFATGGMPGAALPHASVSGLKVLIEGEGHLSQIVTMRDMDGAGSRMVCRDMEVVGGTLEHLIRLDGTVGSDPTAILSDVLAEPTVAAIATFYANEWAGTVLLSNIVNPAPVVPLQARSAGNTATLNARATNVIGIAVPEGSGDVLPLGDVVSGWAAVGGGSRAYRSGASITYAFQLRGPSNGSSVHMMSLPHGWRPSSAGIAELKTFNSGSSAGDVFIGTDGQVTAYRPADQQEWSYGAITLPAA